MHFRWQVLSSEQRQFIATFSDAIISETKNIFSIFFLHILKLDSIMKIYNKKKMALMADIFLNLRTPKDVVR